METTGEVLRTLDFLDLFTAEMEKVCTVEANVVRYEERTGKDAVMLELSGDLPFEKTEFALTDVVNKARIESYYLSGMAWLVLQSNQLAEKTAAATGLSYDSMNGRFE